MMLLFFGEYLYEKKKDVHGYLPNILMIKESCNLIG